MTGYAASCRGRLNAMQNFPPPGVTAREATRLFLNADRVDSGPRFEEGGRVVIENADFTAKR